MFNLEEHVDLSENITPINSPTEQIQSADRLSDTEILVKICLDQDEGLPAAEGRYATFYNMYLVSKAWVCKDTNGELLPKRFPAFVLVDFPGLSMLVQNRLYKPETKEWFAQNASDYYMLMPITTVKKGQFKFSGVHIPVYGTQRQMFKLDAYRLAIIGTCYFGSWYSLLTGSMSGYSSNRNKRIYKEKINTVDQWVHSEIERLNQSLV